MPTKIISLFSTKKSAQNPSSDLQKKQLLHAIDEIREQIAAAYSAFNNTVDASLIEACIYEIKSLQAKYNYYITCAKLENIHKSRFSA